MENYLLGILGILVSIATFLLGYRQTVGAKKERIRTANKEIENLLVRRIVLEQLVPTRESINRLMNGKSRDFRVKVSDLYSEAQTLNVIYTRIIETDLIAKDHRNEILESLEPVIAATEKEPYSEDQALELATQTKRKGLFDKTPFAMGAAASLIGALVAITTEFTSKGYVVGSIEPIFIAVLMSSIVAITAISLILKFKEKQEEVTSESSLSIMDKYIQLETDILKSISKIKGLEVKGAGIDKGYDFTVDGNGRKAVIEVKAWRSRPPISILKKTIDRVAEASKLAGANEAYIVTKNTLQLPLSLSMSESVKIVTVSELKERLAA